MRQVLTICSRCGCDSIDQCCTFDDRVLPIRAHAAEIASQRAGRRTKDHDLTSARVEVRRCRPLAVAGPGYSPAHASYRYEISTGTPLPTLPLTTVAAGDATQRQLLAHRARLLTYLGLGWHALEASVAITAGVIAGSVALVGFGADSVIEASAGLVVLWLVTGERLSSLRSERHAQQLIAASFLLLAIYISVQAARELLGGHHPAVSWAGVGLSVVTLMAMPPLAAAKRRVGTALGSLATASESRQTMLCAYLSAALLVGLLANAIAGLWWADPAVALLIGTVALREARDAWRGHTCSCC